MVKKRGWEAKKGDGWLRQRDGWLSWKYSEFVPRQLSKIINAWHKKRSVLHTLFPAKTMYKK